MTNSEPWTLAVSSLFGAAAGPTAVQCRVKSNIHWLESSVSEFISHHASSSYDIIESARTPQNGKLWMIHVQHCAISSHGVSSGRANEQRQLWSIPLWPLDRSHSHLVYDRRSMSRTRLPEYTTTESHVVSFYQTCAISLLGLLKT